MYYICETNPKILVLKPSMKKSLLLIVFFLNTVLSFGQLLDFEFFMDTTGSCDWNPVDSNKVAIALRGSDGYFDVYSVNTDGTNKTCITCGTSVLPGKHQGSPSYHPSGNYLVITVEKAVHPGSSIEALPGLGGYTDIWIVTSDGSKAWPLTNTANDSTGGAMYCFFSPDGTQLMWTERSAAPTPAWDILNWKQLAGFWVIKVADFHYSPDSVYIDNIRTYGDTNPGFYECYGWSPDGSRILFSSDYNQLTFWDNQVFTLDAATGGDWKQLTKGNYNEQSFYTPDGSAIVYMCNKTNQNTGCDWWIMNADSTNKHRITFFNDSTSSQYVGYMLVTGLGHFSPNGKKMIAETQNPLVQIATAYLVDWNPDVMGTEENPVLQDDGLIYPNPSGGKITMNLPAETKQIEVVSLNGQTLLKINTAGKKSVSLEHLESGCYIIKFISEKGIRTKKIIVNSNL